MIDLSAMCTYSGRGREGDVVALRPMQPADEPVFRDLYAEMRGPELQLAPWPDTAKRAFCDSQYGLQDKHYRTHYVQFLPLAVCVGDEVVGRLYLAEFDDALILMDIVVAERFRRRGIGGLLIGAAVTLADRLGVEARLHVEPQNPVKRHYESLGFRDAGPGGIYQQMVRAAKPD